MGDFDLRYEPLERGYAWMADLRPSTCLVIGEVPDGERDAVSAISDDIRELSSTPLSGLLRRGCYVFQRAGSWHSLVLMAGRPSAAPEQGRKRAMEDNHLVHAGIVHEAAWEKARSFASGSLFHVGDHVRVMDTDSVGQVMEVSRVLDSCQYTVVVHGDVVQVSEHSLTKLEGNPGDPAFWLTQRPADAAGIALTLTWTKLQHPLTDTLYSFSSSKTVFRAYQFKPVLKLLNGSSGRLLIADEVGLGKTIEAGLVWSELEQRLGLERVLVVAPASLTLKWQAEMARRFDRDLELLTTARLGDFAERLEQGAHPQLRGVISLESLRVASGVLDRLVQLNPKFDLVIVDEAHSMRNRESKSHAVGRLLADWADYLILLSATPLNLGNDDLFNLVNLLDEKSFVDRAVFDRQLAPNEVLNRVGRALTGASRFEPRKALADLDGLAGLQFGSTVMNRPEFRRLRELLDVDRPLRHDEVAHARRLLTALNALSGVLTRTRKADVPHDKAVREPRTVRVEWTREERDYYNSLYNWYMRRALAMGTPPGFAMQMPLRLAASCIPASQEALRTKEPALFRAQIDDFDDAGDEVFDLSELRALITSVTLDTKYDRLLAELRRVRAAGLHQVMIFSFFRGTLAYLAGRLSEHFSVRVMDGLVPPSEREQIMKDFRHGDFELLLLSEVGSEGLDFEFCNVLVNYDLPWNPMRVEQRIGRLDRFGQRHEKIFIYNMEVPGTIETDIFQRLYDRIQIFHGSIGDLEPILRDELDDIHKRVLDPKLDAIGRMREIDRIAVAMEQRAHDIEELKTSQVYLSGIDDLLIEGLTDDGPSNGRYIGPGEIRQLLNELFKRLGGRLQGPDRAGVFKLVGTEKLAARLRHSGIGGDGSRYSQQELVGRLFDGMPILCTFEPEEASNDALELLSARHPLVKLALKVLGEEDLALPRFGAVTVPGLSAGRRLLAAVDLATTSGLRPLTELWVTAVDLDTGTLDTEAGDLLLTALAEGDFGEGPSDVPMQAVQQAWRQAREHASERRLHTERSRSEENEALVEARIQARESSLDIQIRKAEELIGRLRADGRGDSIIRLHQGRIRNLQADRLLVSEKLARHRRLGVRLTPVAAVLIATQEAHIPSRGTRRRPAPRVRP